MIHWLKSNLETIRQSDFGRNAAWFTGLSAFERLIAVAQTVLIARALGITEYGVYGLLFGTIGLLASVAGLQMGLTATVFVARYREKEKEKAAAVISIVTRFGWVVAAFVLIGVLPFAKELSGMLLGSKGYEAAILLGACFVGGSILSGVQDGIAQGFEVFTALAKLKIVVAMVVFALIYPAANAFGLVGALSAILGGLVAKYVLLQRIVMRCRANASIPATGDGVSFLSLIGGFSIPSVLISVITGFVTWLGMFLLSKQPAGFDGVAIVNTGLQWRGPILLMASSLGSVALPLFGRLSASNDNRRGLRLRNSLLLANMIMAGGAFAIIAFASESLLGLYGEEFQFGRTPFLLIVLATVPSMIAQVYFQRSVGAAKMWRVLIYHVPYLILGSVLFVVLVPRFHTVGYAYSFLISSTLLLVCAMMMDSLNDRRYSSSAEYPVDLD